MVEEFTVIWDVKNATQVYEKFRLLKKFTKIHSQLQISRAHSDGKYYCNGITCNRGKSPKSRIGVTTQRKICFTIYVSACHP